MEPGVKEYLLRILNTISIVGICLILNITAGLRYELAVINEHIQWQNIAFYIFFLVSIIATTIYIIKLWKKPLDLNP